MMSDKTIKHDKGVAGLTILLSLVTMLFVIGLLVFIFAIMGGEIRDSTTLTAENTGTDHDSTFTSDTAGELLTACDNANQGVVTVITSVFNATNSVLLNSANYTLSGCTLTATDPLYNNTAWNVTYTYTYAGAGWNVANDTVGSISNVTDWYTIFIVIAAMVVLILLTVIIITAIRSSGLMAGGSSRSGNVGSA